MSKDDPLQIAFAKARKDFWESGKVENGFVNHAADYMRPHGITVITDEQKKALADLREFDLSRENVEGELFLKAVAVLLAFEEPSAEPVVTKSGKSLNELRDEMLAVARGERKASPVPVKSITAINKKIRRDQTLATLAAARKPSDDSFWDFDDIVLPKWEVTIVNIRNGAHHTKVIEAYGGEDAANRWIASFKTPANYAIVRVRYKKK